MQIMWFYIPKHQKSIFSPVQTRKQRQTNTHIRTLTTQWVVLAESVITFLAVVAARAFDVGFAATLSCDHPHVQVGVTVTHSSLQGSDGVTVTG